MEVPVEVWACLTVILCSIHDSVASKGDNSWVFSRCKAKCLKNKCTNLEKFYAKQPFYLRALQWECVDECKYSCMWKTVDAFQKDGLAVPQFHGKWPFVRILGIQEPASVLFSILNFLAHFMIFDFRRKVPPSTPMYYVWHGAALVGLNAWFWSTVFHTRDTDFTEKMDYFCAFSVAMYSLFGMCCRLLGTERWWRPAQVGAAVLLGYAYHIHYLGWVRFDYAYNMKANVFVGCCVLLGWLGWCIYTHKKHRYVWKCVVFVVLMNLLLSLELLDFPPFFWTLDAHSLWHAGTVPMCLLWYSFLRDDCLQLMKDQQDSETASRMKDGKDEVMKKTV